MPDVDLARREGVELVNTGSWEILSGTWEPNRTDILAAVEAAQCSAVRRPKIKLGHLDPRFNKPEPEEATQGTILDGTPSLGWFDNLRASSDGETLLGDQVALPWLTKVQAAAWPDRSIEGKRNVRCALGHSHPFVITAVSLLGETPPGIPTLKSIRSLDDLPAALGVAASGEDSDGGEDVQATIRAAAEPDAEPVHTGAMVALIPTIEDAARLAVDGGLPVEEIHLTLAYLGEAADLGAQGKQDVIDAVSRNVNGLPVLAADVFAAAAFNPGDTNDREPCLVYLISGDPVDAVHDLVDEAMFDVLSPAPIPPQHRPWFAHVTGIYTGDLALISDLAARVGPITFDRVRLAFAGDVIDIPLIPDTERDPALEPVAASAQIHTRIDELRAARDVAASATPLEVTFRPGSGDAVLDALRDAVERNYSTPELPAAEPEQPNPDPKEDLVSTELSGIRSRLGLDDTADEQAILSALDELKVKADTPAPPAEPTPEMVAASAAATEKAEKATAAADLMKEELARLSGELATIKASAAQTVKASFFSGLLGAGQLKPADEETWSVRYDRDPQMVTEILSARAPGSEVPVMASGVAGPPEPAQDDDAEWAAMVARLDAPTGKVA